MPDPAGGPAEREQRQRRAGRQVERAGQRHQTKIQGGCFACFAVEGLHRIYKVRDPRAEVLAGAAARLFEAGGDPALHALVQHVERTAVALLEE